MNATESTKNIINTKTALPSEAFAYTPTPASCIRKALPQTRWRGRSCWARRARAEALSRAASYRLQALSRHTSSLRGCLTMFGRRCSSDLVFTARLILMAAFESNIFCFRMLSTQFMQSGGCDLPFACHVHVLCPQPRCTSHRRYTYFWSFVPIRPSNRLHRPAPCETCRLPSSPGPWSGQIREAPLDAHLGFRTLCRTL